MDLITNYWDHNIFGVQAHSTSHSTSILRSLRVSHISENAGHPATLLNVHKADVIGLSMEIVLLMQRGFEVALPLHLLMILYRARSPCTW